MGLYFKLIRDVQAVNTNTAELGTIWKLNLSRVIVCLLIRQISLCKNATGNLSFLRRKETIFIYFTVIIFVVYEREQNWCPRKGTSHKKQKIYIFDKFPTLHHGFFSFFFPGKRWSPFGDLIKVSLPSSKWMRNVSNFKR